MLAIAWGGSSALYSVKVAGLLRGGPKDGGATCCDVHAKRRAATAARHERLLTLRPACPSLLLVPGPRNTEKVHTEVLQKKARVIIVQTSRKLVGMLGKGFPRTHASYQEGGGG